MRRYEWRPARVESVRPAASGMVALIVQPDEWLPHLAGQHYELRFPGERLSRKFSIASGPNRRGELEFGVQVMPRGMLSPRLAAAAPGDRIEIRGPTGVAFAWAPEDEGPLLLLGAGSGITPLLSIREDHQASRHPDPLLFILSARSRDRVYRHDELINRLELRLTAEGPRIDRPFLLSALTRLGRDTPLPPRARVCGPSGFRKTMVQLLIELGVPDERIRSEGFV